MKCRPGPEYKRFNLRLNPSHEKHQQFIDILEGLPSGERSEHIINAVLAYGQEDEHLAILLRKVIREELQGVSFISPATSIRAAEQPENAQEETRTQRSKLDTEGLKNFFNSL